MLCVFCSALLSSESESPRFCDKIVNEKMRKMFVMKRKPCHMHVQLYRELSESNINYNKVYVDVLYKVFTELRHELKAYLCQKYLFLRAKNEIC